MAYELLGRRKIVDVTCFADVRLFERSLATSAFHSIGLCVILWHFRSQEYR